MKKSYQKKIASIISNLEELIEQMEEEKSKIEDRAAEHDRDMTEAEEEKYDEYDFCVDNLQNAIDYISEYADYE